MKELNYVNRKELLDLFNSIGSLWNFDKDKQNELTKKMSAKIIDYLHNHKAENSSVEFSLRQKTVIEVLMKVCHHTLEQAETCAMITHYKGKCAVKSGTYEELEPYYISLLNHHLYAKIQ